ncbi:MAG: DEAD/DEAH box helicase family protein [Nocardioidaceae bacterium]
MRLHYDSGQPHQRAAIDSVLGAVDRAVRGEGPSDLGVEMETGTGKTYVYVRTLAELYARYGWDRFVVVVPSVAIREGVLASFTSMDAHVRELHGFAFNVQVYDGSKPARVREFATAPIPQVLVINIDAFSQDANLIRRPQEALGGYAPLDLIARTRPAVVLDEPQNLETALRQAAVASLEPRLLLRYSATHRDPRNLVYRLTPTAAHDAGLVKRIGVVAVSRPSETGVAVARITAGARGVTARATVDGTPVTLRLGADLAALTGMSSYAGWVVSDIRADRGAQHGEVRFANGRRALVGVAQRDLHRLQLRLAIEAHFEKELQLARLHAVGVLPAPVKPLTLVFVDRVAQYAPADSELRQWFATDYEALRADPRFAALDLPPAADVHDGYFATTPKGIAKDARPESRDANLAFTRIMRDKERLLGLQEPLRFVFSHSALAEGWDNPNVFTLCHLQSGSSTLRRRQQIGRGLRLPVDIEGRRCRLPEVNLLTVVAGESFASFAKALQTEVAADTGEQLPLVHLRRPGAVPPAKLAPEPKRSEPDPEQLTTEVVRRLRSLRELRIERGEVGGPAVEQRRSESEEMPDLPGLLRRLQAETGLSRATLVRLIRAELSNHCRPSSGPRR